MHTRTLCQVYAHTVTHKLVPLTEGEKRKEKRREKRNRSPGIAVRVGGSYLVKIIYYPHPRLIDAVD